ncbi:AMP-binding protein [Sphingomonas sp. MMS24-JH45]
MALYGAHSAFEPLESLLGDAAGTPPAIRPEQDDDVLQLYTSGTTGLPKGAASTNRNYRRFMEMAVDVAGFADHVGDAVMIVMPLFHVAGPTPASAGWRRAGGWCWSGTSSPPPRSTRCSARRWRRPSSRRR